jgi:hypothetical protein
MGVNEYGKSKSIAEFRKSVISRGGVQQPNRYRVIMVDNSNTSIVCYPESVTLPQRSFNTVPYTPWGPVMQIPIRREYGECAMSFIIYQDWAERRFLENWMNGIVIPHASAAPSEAGVNYFQRLFGPGAGGLLSTREASGENYADYSNAYNNSYGTILIGTQPAEEQSLGKYTATLKLNEAYPLTITPTSLSSESSGYATYVVIFAFKDYVFE